MFDTSPFLAQPDQAAVFQGRIAGLNTLFRDHPTEDVMTYALSQMGHMALVSSFGAESVVLLHLAARIDRATPVLFIDTEMLFPETLAYQQDLTEQLGLTAVTILRAGDSTRQDSAGDLHARNPDACCNLRKTRPLVTALRPYDGWISGRKRFQSGRRADLELFEQDGAHARIKVNPLAHWSQSDIAAYMQKHDLPRHPLTARGYPSLGCAPCTSPVAQGEDTRAGRWRNQAKDECGIHIVDGKIVRQMEHMK